MPAPPALPEDNGQDLAFTASSWLHCCVDQMPYFLRAPLSTSDATYPNCITTGLQDDAPEGHFLNDFLL